jgi:cytoskeletal protein RodZ
MMEKGITVGQHLQKHREADKIPLEAVAGVTRIRLSYLQALERDEFHLLPAEAFTRGFLRSYAKFIHLDPDKVIAAYHSQTEGKRNQMKATELVASPPSLWKQSLNFLFNVTAKFMGASLDFSLGKAALPPKH